MTTKELKKHVCEANLELVSAGLVISNFGNASGIDRNSGNIVIKPSGLAYDDMKPEHMVVVSLETGEVVESDLRPSSDTPTHLELYRAFETIGGIVHTHSLCATAWAQAGRDLTPLGTTHADYFRGLVPCTRQMTDDEINDDYEANTGRVIIERFGGMNPSDTPAVLVARHGPFVWGDSPAEAVNNAVILEYLARLAIEPIRIEPSVEPLQPKLLKKHFLRKHGPGAYYGQKKN